MIDVLPRLRDAFAKFTRPKLLSVHGDSEDCLDCASVEEMLADKDCQSLLIDPSMTFARLPLDCLNAAAFLHFFPAIARQSLEPEGQSVAESVAWILGVGADDWDTDATISQQIKPLLNDKQQQCIRDFLSR
jgi:hypothetical protein